MDHTRPRHVRRRSDPPPETDPETIPGAPPDPAPPSEGHVLDRLYGQWREGVPDGEAPILLQHTVLEDPAAGPYLALLTGDTAEHDDLGRLWDETQRASDATILGRIARPLVLLEPVAGRWTVVRMSLGRTAREPLSHPHPLAALAAARTRLGEVLRSGGIASDEAALRAFLGLDEAPDEAASDEAEPGQGQDEEKPDPDTGTDDDATEVAP
jgi:hypothetical protein